MTNWKEWCLSLVFYSLVPIWFLICILFFCDNQNFNFDCKMIKLRKGFLWCKIQYYIQHFDNFLKIILILYFLKYFKKIYFYYYHLIKTYLPIMIFSRNFFKKMNSIKLLNWKISFLPLCRIFITNWKVHFLSKTDKLIQLILFFKVLQPKTNYFIESNTN